MIPAVIHFFTQFPPYLSTLLMAVFPITERFALSFALLHYHMPIWEGIFLVIIGNMVPVITILLLAEKFHNWISKHDSIFGKTWVKSVAHAQAKFARYEKYGLFGILFFLSIPSPLNGVYTASLIAFILGYPMHKSLPYLFAGVIIGNLATLGFMFGLVKLF